MALRVNNNIAALNSKRQLSANNRMLGQKLERLASGLRINRAADDAAGLSVREGMRAEISGLKVNVSNAEQASNLLQVAEGSLNEVNAILVRMRELAVQSSSSTVTDQNRESIQAEFSQLTQEIDRIAQATVYNEQTLLTGFGNAVNDGSSTAVSTSNATGVTDVRISGAQTGTYTFVDANASDGEVTLGNGTATQTIRLATQLDGSDVATGSKIVANFDRLGVQVTLAGASVEGATGAYSDGDLDGTTIQVDAATGGSFQVGPTDSAFNRIEVNVGDMTATGSKLNLGSAGVASISDARSAITTIDVAITEVAAERGNLGAFQNRLSFTIAYTENEIENIQASEASISDADVAAEVTQFTRAQILSQASTAMLAQANVIPQNALALLQ
ncbi:MAG: flagellin [Candidatus Latescibacterota bacterium]|nr:flagellin [Candidatus Latescibacterota bacterium]